MIIERDAAGHAVRITMRWWDNWHNHFRRKGDPRFNPTIDYISRFCRRANGMGNHSPGPTLAAAQMLEEKADVEAVAALLGRPNFRVLPVIMVSPDTTAHMVEEAIDAGAYGIKVMPANVTTNSSHGLVDYFHPRFLDGLRVLVERRKSLLLHAELSFVKGAEIPLRQRSQAFVPVYARLRDLFPNLRICIEHIDIREFVEIVYADENACATVTLQHMDVTSAMADADVHLQCMPYPKSPEDVEAVREAVMMRQHPRFFYGSDNAPHLRPTKERTDGKPAASGVFTAPVEPSALIDLFERHGCPLEALEPFTSEFGAEEHDVPFNEGTITLERVPTKVPEVIDLGGGHEIVPYKHGQTLQWRLVE